MVMATAARPGPNIPAATVGRVVKNDPLATPLITAKTISGPIVSETGHMASMLTALSAMVTRNMLMGPTLSHSGPATKRPTALQALNAATKPAPVLELRPIDLAKRGRKYGGTKSARHPIAPARNTATKGNELSTRVKSQHAIARCVST
jgi:hypothetical protein